MDFIKRNWFLVVVTIILLVATVVLSLVYSKSSAATKVAHTRFLEVIETEIGINTYDVAPTESNVGKAETNIGAAEDELVKLMEKVNEFFPALGIKDLNGFEVKNELVAAYKEMDLALSENGVENAVASYGFREFDNRIPNSEERKMVLRQLRVVRTMIGVAAEAGLMTIEAIVRPPDLPMLEHTLYRYYTFQMAVSGDMNSVRNLMNNLHEAKLCLVVRNLEFAIRAAPMSQFGLAAPLVDVNNAAPPVTGVPHRGVPPGYEYELDEPPIAVARPEEDEGLASLADNICTEHRIVWRESAHVQATIHIDYIEFRQPEKQE